MGDLFDYIVFYLLSLLLAVLKITAFITWPWWVVALPAGCGLAMCVLMYIASINQ